MFVWESTGKYLFPKLNRRLEDVQLIFLISHSFVCKFGWVDLHVVHGKKRIPVIQRVCLPMTSSPMYEVDSPTLNVSSPTLICQSLRDPMSKIGFCLARQWMKERGISFMALSSGYTYLTVCLAPQGIKERGIFDMRARVKVALYSVV